MFLFRREWKLVIKLKMNKQKRIMDFFKPNGTNNLSGGSTVPSKKIKTDVKEARNTISTHPSAESCVKLKDLKSELEIIDTGMGHSWFLGLEKEFSKPYFLKLNDFIVKERKSFTIFPNEENVWSWTKHSTLEEVKVVIIGQDPYHNPGQAHGLCFSVQKGVSPPPSLVNIYKELKTDIPDFLHPGHGNLTKWAEQGVLLINACLTVRKNEPNSHANNGWENLTDAVIKCISESNEGVVFLLWGAYAQKKAAHVDKKKHHLLKAPHPSPLSASRGFIGCKHFSQCNQLLIDSGKAPINWVLD